MLLYERFSLLIRGRRCWLFTRVIPFVQRRALQEAGP